MGDILSLYEKAMEQYNEEEAKKLEERFQKNSFGFDDFLQQMHRMRQMGGFMSMLKFLPGMNNLPPDFQAMADKDINRLEGIINSMTPAERRTPDIINQSRRIRISKGCAVPIQDLNQLLKQFQQMKQVMAKLKNNGLGGLPGTGGGLGSLLSGGLGGLASMFGGGGDMPSGGGAPQQRMPFGGFRPQQSAQQAAQQKKRIEQKKQAKKSRQRNRKK